MFSFSIPDCAWIPTPCRAAQSLLPSEHRRDVCASSRLRIILRRPAASVSPAARVATSIWDWLGRTSSPVQACDRPPRSAQGPRNSRCTRRGEITASANNASFIYTFRAAQSVPWHLNSTRRFRRRKDSRRFTHLVSGVPFWRTSIQAATGRAPRRAKISSSQHCARLLAGC